MPLPVNQNWVVDQRGRRPPPALGGPTSTGQNNLPPGLNSGDAGFTRQVQANELAGTHMEELGRGDNRILQQARTRGVRQGASRGGINSNLAAAGGEEAWLNAAGDVAMQQAGAYGTAAGQNLDSLRQQRMSAEGNQAQITSADIGANASIYGADRDFEAARERNVLDRDRMAQDRDLTLSDREYRAGESQRDRDYTTGRDETQHGYQRELERDRYGYEQMSEEDRAARDADSYMFRQLIDNPEEFDEDVLLGMQDFWARFRPRMRPKAGP
jgi:hypothetical protein